MSKLTSKSDYFYGIHAIQAIIERRPQDVLTLFLHTDRHDARIQQLVTLAGAFGISVQKAHKDKLEKLSKSKQHQGVVAQVRALPVLSEADIEPLVLQLPQGARALFLLLDQITDPHNLGAILRTAAAMGVTAVITTKDKSASLTPTVCKVAAGGAELTTFVQVTNLARCLKQLKQLGCFVVGTALEAHSSPLHMQDLTQHVALVVGAEEKGLRRLTVENCDAIAHLQMLGDMQSLNASVATGMALYEVMRQRLAQSGE